MVQQYLQEEALTPQQLDTVNELAETYRTRLCDLSWFMAKLNETIARQANKEDKCSGRFWQGRYDARALLDETALITAMMYVDLNPIRAGLATTLEGSDYTSIQQRVVSRAKATLAQSLQQGTKKHDAPENSPSHSGSSPTRKTLLPFLDADSAVTGSGEQTRIPMLQDHYLQLIEWTGQTIRADKRGAIPADMTSILDKLNINNEKWLDSVTQLEKKFGYAFGPSHLLERFREKLAKQWLQGKRFMQAFYGERHVA